ncbi:hypothetical protein DRF65_05565 [Chryseobacterium pennae]|uniref:Uncharacterized protein n=1 Tax=Chryseobacterium pennae TaxID=2258962 RepID=A0A3D9CCQ9_9FLAO|nr:hypothetical protein [Chryseobacterium pennae]REC63559.1 hypothetical protein DRF65_05565 [Chryseobacterium pennae]
MKKKTLLTASLIPSLFLSQVGISTPNPTEVLDVNGIERIRELPKHNTDNTIFTKPDGTKSENKDQPFKATKMVVADANGVLGYADWNPNTTPDNSKKRITIGYWAGLWDNNYYAVGAPGFPTFNSQLQSKFNYGPNGTYNKIDGIDFQEFETIRLDMYTAAQLKNFVDVFCIGLKVGEDISIENATKIKDFVDLGGVAIVLLDRGRNKTALQAFGISGNVLSAPIYAYPLSGSIGTSGVFGNTASNVTITGSQTAGLVLNTQLPSGAELLARGGNSQTESLTDAGIWTAGTGGRAIFFWDEGAFRNSSIAGTIIDTDQEKYLHNLMAYLLDKLNL